MVVSGVKEFHGKVARSLYAVITLIQRNDLALVFKVARLLTFSYMSESGRQSQSRVYRRKCERPILNHNSNTSFFDGAWKHCVRHGDRHLRR